MKSPTLIELLNLLPSRPSDSHKGNFGHVLIVGGNAGMLGSVILVAQGACSVGSGLITVATHPEHAPLVSLAYPNVMSHAIKNSRALTPLLEKASIIIIGPGLGQDTWAKQLLSTVLDSNLSLIIDADALNLLAQKPSQRDNWILTPHPGEVARLLNTDVKTIQQDRLTSAVCLQKNYQGIVVLKGAGTIIYDEINQTILCQAGNSGMSTGGMGDLLSGMIAGLVAQGLGLFDAASLAVYLHAHAADLAKASQGERGMLPQDLFSYVRGLLNGKV